MEPLDPVLDSEQLVRIEATHRGFTYQNLYGVACLLTMNATGTISVIFEHDEDVELLRADTHIYLQIKTRQNSLVLSDISSTLDRFAQIRNEHTLGNRKRNAEFAIISNVKPGPELHRMLATESWPSDVEILWPGVYDDDAHLSLPPVSADLDTAYSSCVELANNIPFRSLSPATLVLKLAGLAQRFSAGHNNHRANLDDVKGYLEQLVVQLQDFPSAPKIYMPQRGEPEMATLERIRLLVGPSGSGKTSWASQIARLSTRESTYLSVGEMPESAVSSTLARELAARFEFELEFRGIGLASTATGIELLKFIDKQVARSRRDITIVLDDTHQLQTGTVRSIIEALSGVNFILLAQPWTGMSELEVRLNIKAEMFRGWSLDSIAAAFARAGCAINAGHAARVIEITGGAPLYVLNGAQLTAEVYHGDVDEFISAIESRRNITKSAQEVILSEVFEKLRPASNTVAALLSLASIPLFADEIHELTAIESQSADLTASAIRDLTSRGLASASIDGSVKLHDAYRIVAVDSHSADSSRKLQDARVKLADIIEKSLPSRGNAGRFSLWIKLLSQTGRIENLINIAVQEFFHEAGDQRGVWSAIEAAAEQDDLTPEVRFWAFDAMVKWLHRDGRYDAIPPLVHRMSEIAEAGGSSIEHNALVSLLNKQMISAATTGDERGVEGAYEAGQQYLGSASNEALSVLQYNYSVAQFNLANYDIAKPLVEDLIDKYYCRLGITAKDTFGVNPDEILSKVTAVDNPHVIYHHVGDCFLLLGYISNKRKKISLFEFTNAMKFYRMACAWRSYVHAGQEAVDNFLAKAELFDVALNCSESIVSVVNAFKLNELLVPVRAQYAVVLAWCGRVDDARAELARIESYATSDEGSAELQNQRNLIEEIAAAQVD